MTKLTAPTVAEAQQTRLALLANGYSPLPNLHKACVLKGWPKVQITEDTIEKWTRERGFRATGIRLDNGLIAIDADVDDAGMRDRIYEELLDAAPQLDPEKGGTEPPERHGRGAKVCWFVRRDPNDSDKNEVGYWPTTLHVRPGEDPTDPDLDGHRVEIFGARRQIGGYGPHSYEDDGKTPRVMYRWPYGGLDTIPLDELPTITRDQLRQFHERVCKLMEEQGWPRVLKSQSTEASGEVQYTLTDDMQFHCADGLTRSLDEMYEYARHDDPEPRCAADWLEGPQATRTNRCRASITHDGTLNIHVFHVGNFRPADRKPVPVTDKLDQLADKLAEKRPDIDLSDLPEDATEGHKRAVFELLHNWAFCASHGTTTMLPIYDEETASVSPKNKRDEMRSYDYIVVGPRGGATRTSPVDVWLGREDKIIVKGYLFRPDMPQGVIEVDGARHINSFRPAKHAHGPNPKLAKLFEDFLAHLIPDEGPREWLKDRIAHKVQNPLTPGVGTLFYSPIHGTGRGTLFDIIRGVLGDHNASNLTAAQLLGSGTQSQYNDWQQNKLVGFVEEVLQNGDDGNAFGWRRRKDYEKLKEYMEPRARKVRINRKTLPNVDDLVCLTLFMATNHDNALPVDPADRRLVVIRNTDEQLGGALKDRIDTQRPTGVFTEAFVAAVYHWSMARDVSAFTPHVAPDWGGKEGMVAANETELDELADDILAQWPVDWAERGAFADRFAREVERKKLLPSGNVRNIAGDLLKRRWKLSDRPYVTYGKRKTIFYRTIEEKNRFAKLAFADRDAELTLQEQLDSKAPAEVLAKRLGIAVVKEG